jgi:hypothetical protein
MAAYLAYLYGYPDALFFYTDSQKNTFLLRIKQAWLRMGLMLKKREKDIFKETVSQSLLFL